MAPQNLEAEKLIGQALLEKRLLNQMQLDQLLATQTKQKMRLGEAAVKLGFVAEADLAKFLAGFFDLPYVELEEEEELDLKAVELIPQNLARRYELIIIKKEGDVVTVAMADPLDVRALDAVRLETQCRIRKAVASRAAILKAIQRFYHATSLLARSMDHLFGEKENEDAVQARIAANELTGEIEQLKHEASDAPVVQFVNLLLMRAIQERASDIHIEAGENCVTVRLRIDGQLREVSAPPKPMLQAITTRIKLMGDLNIAERRLPQDGRFKFKAFDKTIDVRLSSLPTVYGEKLVLRILDRGSLILDMPSLGFEPRILANFRRALELPHGLIILTGPTGSGKTTTLYAALNAIKTPTKNIVTIEDPVEYQLSKINQVHTRADIGLTFAAGLRSILRQDPDIIMVGEVRDRETAEICIRSSLTGHLVLSTLHTNDALSAISRLIDMGIEPYLLSATLTIVMAQRLVRRICAECSQPWEPPAELLSRLRTFNGNGHSNGNGGASSWKFRRGKGCLRCGQTGYLGRIAVYEQFLITDKIQHLIAENAGLKKISEQARQDGYLSLLEAALNKVREGLTTLDEALSICSTQGDIFE